MKITKRIVISLAISAVMYMIITAIYAEYNKFELVSLSERASWLNTKQKVERRAVDSIEALIRDSEADGMCIVVTSGYRSIEEQEKIKAKYGDLAEDPGKSEHQTGYAVDLTACPMKDGVRDDSVERDELKKSFEELPEYKWVVDHADKYRLSQTYEHEPWHWKYDR